MADNSLKDPVIVRAVSLNASSLPAGYSPAYTQYILSQALDFTSVAGKANEAGQGAYEAQVKNDEQDELIADHESRIKQLRIEVDDHEIRITANTLAISSLDIRLTDAEGNITALQASVSALDTRVTAAETDIDNIQADYVSKSATATQTILSPINVASGYFVNGLRVVGPRVTGWTAATGTALLGAFNANQAYSAGATYSQSEMSALATGLQQVRQRVKALEDVDRAHGLINQ